MKKNIRYLQDLTSQESGAVSWPTGDIWIGNWVGIEGLPREFATGTIGLGDDLSGAKHCSTPATVISAMQDHARNHGDEPNKTGYKSWLIGEVVITIQKDWN